MSWKYNRESVGRRICLIPERRVPLQNTVDKLRQRETMAASVLADEIYQVTFTRLFLDAD